MSEASAADLLKNLEQGYALPALSVVALKLVELASDDTCSVNDLAALIEKDPALTVRLLKLANSALFQSGKPVSTLKQAIIKVGFHRLRIMALSLSLRETFPMGKKGPLDYEKFWRTSIYRALLSKSLAQNLGTCDPEEAFVAGLILEIGFLIFFDLVIEKKDEDVRIDLDSLEESLAWERERYGADHRQIGEAALRYWKFPDGILNCQGVYGEKALAEGVPALAKVCAIANSFAGILFQGSKDFSSLFEQADRSVGLDPEVMIMILMETFDHVQDIAENLKLELNKEKDLILVMEKANRALGGISEKMTELQDKGKTLPSFESVGEGADVVAHTLQAVAHEIRNPLMAVGGFAKKLAASLDPSSDGGKYVQVILAEATRLEKALSDMSRKGGSNF